MPDDKLEKIKEDYCEKYDLADERKACRAFVDFSHSIKEKGFFVDQDLSDKRMIMNATAQDRSWAFKVLHNMTKKHIIVETNKNQCGNLTQIMPGARRETVEKVAQGCPVPIDDLMRLRQESGVLVMNFREAGTRIRADDM